MTSSSCGSPSPSTRVTRAPSPKNSIRSPSARFVSHAPQRSQSARTIRSTIRSTDSPSARITHHLLVKEMLKCPVSSHCLNL